MTTEQIDRIRQTARSLEVKSRLDDMLREVIKNNDDFGSAEIDQALHLLRYFHFVNANPYAVNQDGAWQFDSFETNMMENAIELITEGE